MAARTRLGAALMRWESVLLVSVLARVCYFASAHGVSFQYPLIDADYYDAIGSALAQGGDFPDGPFWQPPGYPIFLGGLYRLFGESLWWPRLVQGTLSAVSSVLVFRMTERVTQSPPLSTLAGLAHALCGPLLMYDGELLPTSLATSLTLLAGWLSFRPRRSLLHAVLAGACVGLSSLSVATTLLFALPLLVSLWRSGKDRALVAAATVAVVVGGATYANYARTGEWVLISANGGVNLWLGNNPHAATTISIRPGAAWERLFAKPESLGIVSASGQDAYFYGRALRWCASAPGPCLENLLWKARLTVSSREIPRNEDLATVREDAPVLALLTPQAATVGFPGMILWPLCFAGVLAMRGLRTPEGIAVLASVVMLLLPSVLYFPAARYRVPAIPYACVLAAVGVQGLIRRDACRRYVVAALVGGSVVAAMPVVLPVDSVDFHAEMYSAAASRLSRQGDYPRAIALLDEALARTPHSLEARTNLALAQENAGRQQDATQTYRLLLRDHPGEVGAQLRLAGLLRNGPPGSLKQARVLYEGLLRQFPDDGVLRLNVAECLLLEGASAQAAPLISEAAGVLGAEHPEVQRVSRLAPGSRSQ